jgi:hypothetical protein
MATKQQIIDTFFRRLKKARPELEIHRKDLEYNMARAWNQILHDTFKSDLTYLDFYCKDYTNQTVNKDATSKQFYVDLPAAIVQLPDKSEGVRSVEPYTQNFDTPVGTGVQFVPISDTQMRLKDNIDVGLAESSVIGYAVRYDKIMFDRQMTQALATAKVNFKLVVPFNVYTSTENLPVPAGKDEALYTLTLQFILMTVPQREQ